MEKPSAGGGEIRKITVDSGPQRLPSVIKIRIFKVYIQRYTYGSVQCGDFRRFQEVGIDVAAVQPPPHSMQQAARARIWRQMRPEVKLEGVL